jgi:hypothetical protein
MVSIGIIEVHRASSSFRVVVVVDDVHQIPPWEVEENCQVVVVVVVEGAVGIVDYELVRVEHQYFGDWG